MHELCESYICIQPLTFAIIFKLTGVEIPCLMYSCTMSVDSEMPHPPGHPALPSPVEITDKAERVLPCPLYIGSQ